MGAFPTKRPHGQVGVDGAQRADIDDAVFARRYGAKIDPLVARRLGSWRGRAGAAQLLVQGSDLARQDLHRAAPAPAEAAAGCARWRCVRSRKSPLSSAASLNFRRRRHRRRGGGSRRQLVLSGPPWAPRWTR